MKIINLLHIWQIKLENSLKSIIFYTTYKRTLDYKFRITFLNASYLAANNQQWMHFGQVIQFTEHFLPDKSYGGCFMSYLIYSSQ